MRAATLLSLNRYLNSNELMRLRIWTHKPAPRSQIAQSLLEASALSLRVEGNPRLDFVLVPWLFGGTLHCWSQPQDADAVSSGTWQCSRFNSSGLRKDGAV